MMKRLLSVLLIIACALLTGCSLLPEEEVRRAAPVIKQTVAEEYSYAYCTRGDLEVIKKFSVTYVPIQKVSLYFGIEGEYVDEIFVKVGDYVHAGDLLGQLKLDGVDDSIASCERNIENLERQLTQLEENYSLKLERINSTYTGKELEESLKTAHESFLSSRESLEDSLSSARLSLETLNAGRDKRRLVAPIDGTVTYVRKYTESSLSAFSDKAITIADSTMSLFTVKTDYWDYLPEGYETVITVSKVEYEAVVTDPVTLGLPAVEKIPGEKATVYLTLKNPAPDLEDNDKGSFQMLLDERRDVLRINKKAVSKAGDDFIVYYQNEDGVKSYKIVKLGLLTQDMYEVLDGLSEGERVIMP